ncbi:hypothetical protein Tsubulata_023323 [Turnera subulata]|uniref:Uncharacterized protein n=1 Tax=Turnera subulata TaxID=218843 RepID=A0A9Q0FJF5_9ROSI|nr:hypothetical protein Tsubulata_023323 [Turnera subulata]
MSSPWWPPTPRPCTNSSSQTSAPSPPRRPHHLRPPPPQILDRSLKLLDPPGHTRRSFNRCRYIFIRIPDRLGQMVSIVVEAAKQSLKKKGMPVPPWRKPEYMRAKWLSPNFTRLNDAAEKRIAGDDDNTRGSVAAAESNDCGGELDLIFGEKATSWETEQSSSPSFLL